MKTARDLMTSPAETLKAEDTLADAARALKQHDVGAMPVTDSDRVIGILTDRDIVVSGIAEDKDPKTTTIGAIASRRLVYVQADDDAQLVADTLAEHQIRRVPVMDGSELVGMVSQADVARELAAAETGEVVKEISED
ncbi:CBS domain-containing protein [Mariniluteicoccus flavus]